VRRLGLGFGLGLGSSLEWRRGGCWLGRHADRARQSEASSGRSAALSSVRAKGSAGALRRLVRYTGY